MPERLDALDLERFEDMIASPPFALFQARVTAELERARTDCETVIGDVQVCRAQGRCAALRTVLALPAIVAKEIRAKLK